MMLQAIAVRRVSGVGEGVGQRLEAGVALEVVHHLAGRLALGVVDVADVHGQPVP